MGWNGVEWTWAEAAQHARCQRTKTWLFRSQMSKNKLDASLIDASGWNIRHGASMVRLPVWENDG